jgi:hypothetical protein
VLAQLAVTGLACAAVFAALDTRLRPYAQATAAPAGAAAPIAALVQPPTPPEERQSMPPVVQAAPAVAPLPVTSPAPPKPTRTSMHGRLTVFAAAGARVRVAGRERRAPAMLELPTGSHRVEIILARGRRVVRHVDVEADRTSELDVR